MGRCNHWRGSCMSQQTARGTLVLIGGSLGTFVVMNVYHIYSWIGLPPTDTIRGFSFMLSAIVVVTIIESAVDGVEGECMVPDIRTG